VDEMGAVVGPTAVIGQINVTAPPEPPSFKPQYPLEAPFDSGLTLLGYNQDRTEAAPGEQVLLTFFWERTAGSLPENLQIQLLDQDNRVISTWQEPLIDDGFENSAWEMGQRLRAQHLLRLPASLESGHYQLRLQDQVPLADLTISAPDRLFTPPQSATTVEIPFGDEVQLNGFTITRDGDLLTVNLVWQAQGEITSASNVFVHLVDEQGTIFAQSDGEPANWTRPTTGWAPGEYILDRHTLTLPADLNLAELRLRVGLYDPATGRRLPTPGGDGADLFLDP